MAEAYSLSSSMRPLVPSSANRNLAGSDAASQFQRLRLIQRTVRVPASLYTHDKAAICAFQPPLASSANVHWNQASDRAVAHVQTLVTSSGSAYHGSSLRRSLVRLRPGAMSPGGVGVDVKHGSYARYLLRLKGQGPCQSGNASLTTPVPTPLYGGKVLKTSIAGAGWGDNPNPCPC